jgi:ElaB/YqjD/DUF883 family membrane-anchored ribosome-binding protein
MKTEELIQEEQIEIPHFNEHEFDGLREMFEQEAESIFGKLDELIRQHPWVCMALAATAGFAIGRCACGKSDRRTLKT